MLESKGETGDGGAAGYIIPLSTVWTVRYCLDYMGISFKFLGAGSGPKTYHYFLLAQGVALVSRCCAE